MSQVRCDGNYTENLLSVVGFKSEYETPGGVNLPKVTFVLCSDGVTRKQLVKGNDDMRQDSVMEQVFNVANQLLSKCQLTQHLSMRTYKVSRKQESFLVRVLTFECFYYSVRTKCDFSKESPNSNSTIIIVITLKSPKMSGRNLLHYGGGGGGGGPLRLN